MKLGKIAFLIFLIAPLCLLARDEERAKDLVSYAKGLVYRQTMASADDSMAFYEAKDSLAIALSLDPDNAEAHYWFGEVISKIGIGRGLLSHHPDINITTEVVGHMRKALELDPDYSGSYNILGPRENLSTEWGSVALYYLIYEDIDSAKWAFKQATKAGGYDEIILEYSHNFLVSCPPDAILFTNGDMDTFGLLFLQLMQGFRKDVSVINLSLLNLPIYIKYNKSHGVDIKKSDQEIDLLRAYITDTGEIIRVQDIVADEIVKNARKDNKRISPPICFAVTVSPNNKGSWSDYLLMRGVVFELQKVKPDSGNKIDKVVSRDLIFNKMRFKTVKRDHKFGGYATIEKLNLNYLTLMMTLAMAEKDEGDYKEALKTIQFAHEKLDWDWRLAVFGFQIAFEAGKPKIANDYYEEAIRKEPNNELLYRYFSSIAYENGDTEKAIAILKKGLENNPDSKDIIKALVSIYYDLNDTESLIKAIESWLVNHQDEEMKAYLEELKK